MLKHVVKKILDPGKGPEFSHLISEMLQMPDFRKPACNSLCAQVLNSGKVCLKNILTKVLNRSSKIGKHPIFADSMGSLTGSRARSNFKRLKPIFHWKLGSIPNANEINTKNMKCTCPTPEFCVGTQRNLYSTGLLLGMALGKTQILGLASGVFVFSDTNMLVSPRLKCGVGGCKPTPGPDANGFASQWNIGLSL